MVAWKLLYDMWVLPYPPHGTDFVRLDHPFVLETFFSSRHGLLSWTPALWAGYLGFLPLLRRRRDLALPLLAPLALMTYVNLCSGDWWAGGSFSNRRFDSLLPLFAAGFAAALEWARGAIQRRPELAVAAVALPAMAWNGAQTMALRQGLVPADETVAFPRLAGAAALALSERVGFPTTWPASWAFALRHRRPPSQYDRLVGRYLFYRQNNLGGRVEVGAPGDEAMLGEGWGPIEGHAAAAGRRVHGRARVFAPLDGPEDLTVSVRAALPGASGRLRVTVNGVEAGWIAVGSEWDTAGVSAPAAVWRRELNDVVLEGQGVLVDGVFFAREKR
jgi:hypothetical protein